jgi:DNA-binding transcriptional regulator YhcF (GntR family)
MLPNSLIFNPNIGRSALLVYWVLTVHLFKGKEYCFPKIATIAKEARCDHRTVTRAIRELKDAGYLKVVSTPGEVNRYKLKM